MNYSVGYASYSKIKDIDDYMNYYYKTDHRWNYRGSYKGYKDVISLILEFDSFLKPIKEECFSDLKFNGYKAR